MPKCHFSVREVWKRILSFFGQRSAEKDANSADSGLSFVCKKRQRNLKKKPVKDKYNLICFLSTLTTYWKVICTQNERKKLERFYFINSKLVNELCYLLQSGNFDIFSNKRKNKERKKEKEEKDY